ncbi:MAG: MarR family winged helix-turn-helix transcriptional regulator [Dehalococcoidia bacterium]
MPIKFKFEDSYKGAWILLRQAYNLILKCEDKVFSGYRLTTEQHAVLMTIKHISEPVRVTDVALWLDRSVNSISMIVDRMVKAGLVRRVRDRKDRRTVILTITNKAEKAFVPATVAGWELIQEILSPLSNEDRLTLIKLLETLRDKAYDYLGAGEVVEEVRKHEAVNMAQFMKQAAEYESLSALETKRQGSKKKKAIR